MKTETFSTIPTDERNRSEVPAPLGLDGPEFLRVWRLGVSMRGGLGPGKLPPRFIAVCPSEDDVWQLRERCKHCVTLYHCDPKEVALSEPIAAARKQGIPWVILLNGKGEVLKEYPV